MNKRQIGASTLIAAILASVIYIEGGYSDDPYDPGGKTKYGITEGIAREYGYTGKMEDLSIELATKIYKDLYVEQPGFDKFVEINPAIAHKLIDAGINVGTTRVTLWLQRSLNSFSRNGADYPMISADGVIGDKTIQAYQSLEKARGKAKACTLILKALDSYQANYYMSLTNYSRYLTGWIDKRVENIPLDQCEDYNLTLPIIDAMNKSS